MSVHVGTHKPKKAARPVRLRSNQLRPLALKDVNESALAMGAQLYLLRFYGGDDLVLPDNAEDDGNNPLAGTRNGSGQQKNEIIEWVKQAVAIERKGAQGRFLYTSTCSTSTDEYIAEAYIDELLDNHGHQTWVLALVSLQDNSLRGVAVMHPCVSKAHLASFEGVDELHIDLLVAGTVPRAPPLSGVGISTYHPPKSHAPSPSHLLLSTAVTLGQAAGLRLLSLISIDTTQAPSTGTCVAASRDQQSLDWLGKSRGVRRLSTLYHREGFRNTEDACKPATGKPATGRPTLGLMSLCLDGNPPEVNAMPLLAGRITDPVVLRAAFEEAFPTLTLEDTSTEQHVAAKLTATAAPAGADGLEYTYCRLELRATWPLTTGTSPTEVELTCWSPGEEGTKVHVHLISQDPQDSLLMAIDNIFLYDEGELMGQYYDKNTMRAASWKHRKELATCFGLLLLSVMGPQYKHILQIMGSSWPLAPLQSAARDALYLSPAQLSKPPVTRADSPSAPAPIKGVPPHPGRRVRAWFNQNRLPAEWQGCKRKVKMVATWWNLMLDGRTHGSQEVLEALDLFEVKSHEDLLRMADARFFNENTEPGDGEILDSLTLLAAFARLGYETLVEWLQKAASVQGDEGVEGFDCTQMVKHFEEDNSNAFDDDLVNEALGALFDKHSPTAQPVVDIMSQLHPMDIFQDEQADWMTS